MTFSANHASPLRLNCSAEHLLERLQLDADESEDSGHAAVL